MFISSSNSSLVQILASSRTLSSTPAEKTSPTQDNLQNERLQTERLKKLDREVRSHEQAHVSAAGRHALGGPSFKLHRGPDGRFYAVGGEVKIDTSPVRDDPEATIRKMQTVRRAALAPSQPSAKDREVAAKAATQESQARTELMKERTEEMHGSNNGKNDQPYSFSSELKDHSPSSLLDLFA